MKKTEIGHIVLKYNINGAVQKKEFVPTLKTELPEKDAQQLWDSLNPNIHPTQEEKVKQITDMALASWFTRLNEIELRDHEQTEILSEITHCSKFKYGGIRMVKITYYIQDRVKKVNPALN